MRIRHWAARFGLFIGVAFLHTAAADIILETPNLRLVVGEDAILRSLTSRPSGIEYCWLPEPGPVATVYRRGRTFDASQAPFAAHVAFAEDKAPVFQGGQSFPASRVELARAPPYDPLRQGECDGNVQSNEKASTFCAQVGCVRSVTH